MPNPKRRHSKTRTAKRRTHDALKPIPVGACPQCREMKPREVGGGGGRFHVTRKGTATAGAGDSGLV